jgi:hypothetical protein
MIPSLAMLPGIHTKGSRKEAAMKNRILSEDMLVEIERLAGKYIHQIEEKSIYSQNLLKHPPKEKETMACQIRSEVSNAFYKVARKRQSDAKRDLDNLNANHPPIDWQKDLGINEEQIWKRMGGVVSRGPHIQGYRRIADADPVKTPADLVDEWFPSDKEKREYHRKQFEKARSHGNQSKKKNTH